MVNLFLSFQRTVDNSLKSFGQDLRFFAPRKKTFLPSLKDPAVKT